MPDIATRANPGHALGTAHGSRCRADQYRALVEQGRTAYRRILAWIINKVSRTILKASFGAVA